MRWLYADTIDYYYTDILLVAITAAVWIIPRFPAAATTLAALLLWLTRPCRRL